MNINGDLGSQDVTDEFWDLLSDQGCQVRQVLENVVELKFGKNSVELENKMGKGNAFLNLSFCKLE